MRFLVELSVAVGAELLCQTSVRGFRPTGNLRTDYAIHAIADTACLRLVDGTARQQDGKEKQGVTHTATSVGQAFGPAQFIPHR